MGTMSDMLLCPVCIYIYETKIMKYWEIFVRMCTGFPGGHAVTVADHVSLMPGTLQMFSEVSGYAYTTPT